MNNTINCIDQRHARRAFSSWSTPFVADLLLQTLERKGIVFPPPTKKVADADEQKKEQKKKQKYNNSTIVYDFNTFDSKDEALYYIFLREELNVEYLVVHPRYELLHSFTHKGKKIAGIYYEADFSYTQDGKQVVVDVKGVRTDVYRLKIKFFLNKYPDIDFQEVKA